jgi:hypothetical protein
LWCDRGVEIGINRDSIGLRGNEIGCGGLSA